MDWKTLVGFTILFHGIVYAWKRSWILRLDTKRLNKCINGISQRRIRKYFRLWFRLGTYVTITVGFPFTLWLFLRTIFNALSPSVISVALAVTPTSLLYSPHIPEHRELELHSDSLSPYPDAEIPIESPSSSSSSSYLAIQPILPGWNLPLSHLPYYLIAILISVVIHELGHAIASASHRIPILSMGVSLFGPLIPAAHVELNSVQLKETTLKKQLDILTAGVWMNLYLALITFFIVPKLLPILLFPTHSVGLGLAVTGVIATSGAGGPGGLERGDIIVGVENCPVHDLDSWLTCLEKVWEAEPVGYCLNNKNVVQYSNISDNPGCCGPDGDTSPTHLCFMQMTPGEHTETLQEPKSVSKDMIPEHPQESEDSIVPNGSSAFEKDVDKIQSLSNQSNNATSHTSFCLPAKPIVTMDESSVPRCIAPNYFCPKSITLSTSSSDTPSESESNHGESASHLPVSLVLQNESHCYFARILKQYNSFRIIQIHRRQHRTKESVLFVGDVWDLRNGVHSTDFVPRDWFLSRLLGFSTFSLIPVELETVLLLTAGLSAGLAVVNMLPIYGLDGYHIVDAIVRVIVGKSWESRKVSRLVNYISWAAVFMAFLTIFCSVVQSF